MSNPDAVERLAPSHAHLPVVLTCEHASARLPDGWRWHEGDERLKSTHWAFDPGAREIVHQLSAHLGAPAVLSRFTRLLADPNRAEDAPDLFRRLADGSPVELNRAIAEGDRERRLRGFHRPYHDAMSAAVEASPAELIVSVHTFTPNYEGEARAVEVGVLFNHEEELAVALQAEVLALGLDVRLNEPYSGKAGLIYAADRHAEAHGRRAIELEVRQDLAVSSDFRSRFVPALCAALAVAGKRTRVFR
jgi:predicted N-formylglutamate amidohydrolase